MKSIAPRFIVNNVLESVEFYTNKLDFKVEWMHDKNPMLAILSQGRITIMLGQLKKEGFVKPNKIAFKKSGWHNLDGKEAWDAYIWVDDVTALYNKCYKNNLTILKELTTTTYGNKDFEIEDINGYILCFGESLD